MALRGQKTTSDFLEWNKMQSIVLKLERDNDLKFALLIATGVLHWTENFRPVSTQMESGFESGLLHHNGKENQEDPQSDHQPRIADHLKPLVCSAESQ
jgi:hypothetical protein